MRLLPLTDKEKKKHKKGLCITSFCLNKHRKHRCYCGKCQSRRFRESNPMRAIFINLRTNARRRKKAFSLTWDQFLSFIEREHHDQKPRGRTALSASIDRKRNEF